MAQNYSSEGLERLLVQVRRIAEHRERAANKAIKKAYKDLSENLNGWLGNEYAKYADDDALTFDVLRAKGEYARFLDEVQVKIDDIYPEVKDAVQTLIDTTYAACWKGMCDAVVKFDRIEDLKERLSPIKAITPEQVKAAVENPIPKLRLSPILERNRKQIISNIKREIGVGLTNGDRMATMARRISKCVNGDYNKAMLIARTEGHRVREKGFDDSAARIDSIMQDSGSAYRMVKIWKTMQDMSVRHTNLANHVDMEGQTVLEDEDFTLTQSGAKTKCPGCSGIAAEDCNCRCRVTHRIMSDAEFFKATGRHFSENGVDISGESGIIRETSGKDKPITPITDGNIDKVPLVKIPGYDDKQCEYIQEQHKELLRYSRDNNGGNEVAFVFKEDMTRLKPFVGSDDTLNFGVELLGKGNNLTVLHNHPRNGSFSTTDIMLFANNNQIATMTIVKNNGKVEYISKTEDFDANAFRLEYNRLKRKINFSDDERTKTKQLDKLVATLLGKTKAGVIWSEKI